jgi:hypothetical protein
VGELHSILEVNASEGATISEAELSELEEQDKAILAPALRGARWFACRRDELKLALPPVLHPEVFEKHLPALANFARTRTESVGPYR